tara:strand:- start:245 stop:721 length:477 start_codon:yes stop_codon:yes gene_type:complete
MIIIKDDVVDNISTIQDYQQFVRQTNKNQHEKWYSWDEKHELQNFCTQLIHLASNIFDLSKCIGYEFWCNDNKTPNGWHIDKDEQTKIKKGITRLPLCSMVYYVSVENLVGGKLHIEEEIITPKTNRLIIFSPGKYHCVEPFLGTRITYCINPWSIKL